MCAIFYVQYTTYQPPKKNQFSLELIWYFYDFIIIANWLSSDLKLNGAYVSFVQQAWLAS